MKRTSKKTLKAKADKLFSEYVRSYGKCEWCRARNSVQLQTAHVFSRRFLVTRWLPINAVCLCAKCHRKAHDKPVEFTEWLKEYLGGEIYFELRREAKTSVEKQDIPQIIKDLQERNYPYEDH